MKEKVHSQIQNKQTFPNYIPFALANSVIFRLANNLEKNTEII